MEIKWLLHEKILDNLLTQINCLYRVCKLVPAYYALFTEWLREYYQSGHGKLTMSS